MDSPHNIYTRFPAEWEAQDAIMLLWPHENTDWAYILKDAQKCFTDIATAINQNGENIVIISPDCKKVKKQLVNLDLSKIRFEDIPTNDTWARDTCAITTLQYIQGSSNGSIPNLLTAIINDFKFNGWGLKFAADKDNLVTHNLLSTGLFNSENLSDVKIEYRNRLNFVLEGGSIESDGKGTLMTTSQCLLSANRNGEYARQEIEAYLKSVFSVKKILWLDYGNLAGDDTDGHIDTLARFAPDNKILYVECDNSNDTHYDELNAMKCQLEKFTSADGEKYNLIGLPMPSPIYDENGERLPATYANFLIANDIVLVPTYGQQENDNKALSIIGNVFKSHKVIGIDCTALIRQHGSLHCVTMQFPKGSLNLKI